MRALGITALVASAAIFVASEAQAQLSCSPRPGLTTCLPADNLWPSARGPFTWLASANAPNPKSVSFNMTTSWVYRPIGMTVSSAAPEGTTHYPVEHAVSVHLLASLGVTSRLSFDVAAPMTVHQSGAGLGFLTGSDAPLPRSASGELRFGPSYALMHRDRVDLAARFQIVAPTGTHDAFATFGSATFAPGLSAAYRFCRFRFGADVGARIRKAVELADALVGTQVTVGAGAAYDILPNGGLTLGAEAFGLIGVDSQPPIGGNAGDEDSATRTLIPAEWHVSFATGRAMDGKLRLRVGMGGAIPTGATSDVTAPALRTVGSISFTP